MKCNVTRGQAAPAAADEVRHASNSRALVLQGRGQQAAVPLHLVVVVVVMMLMIVMVMMVTMVIFVPWSASSKYGPECA